MGYPFDRKITANTLNDFANKYSNMGTGEVSIRFTDTVID